MSPQRCPASVSPLWVFPIHTHTNSRYFCKTWQLYQGQRLRTVGLHESNFLRVCKLKLQNSKKISFDVSSLAESLSKHKTTILFQSPNLQSLFWKSHLVATSPAMHWLVACRDVQSTLLAWQMWLSGMALSGTLYSNPEVASADHLWLLQMAMCSSCSSLLWKPAIQPKPPWQPITTCNILTSSQSRRNWSALMFIWSKDRTVHLVPYAHAFRTGGLLTFSSFFRFYVCRRKLEEASKLGKDNRTE